MPFTTHKLKLIFNFIIILFISCSFFGCSLFEPRTSSAEKIIAKASQQKIFLASYDIVWRAAHSAVKYTIASENQDYGAIETDFIKAVDGWLPPDQTKPQYKSARYKLYFNFAKGTTNGKESTRVTIEKKVEVFKDFVSETVFVPSDGLEEQSLFYRIEREIIIDKALKKASSISE